MLKQGADNYDEAMSYAANRGYIEIVKLMLEQGADNYNGAMATASYRGYIEIVELIKSFRDSNKL